MNASKVLVLLAFLVFAVAAFGPAAAFAPAWLNLLALGLALWAAAQLVA